MAFLHLEHLLLFGYWLRSPAQPNRRFCESYKQINEGKLAPGEDFEPCANTTDFLPIFWDSR